MLPACPDRDQVIRAAPRLWRTPADGRGAVAASRQASGPDSTAMIQTPPCRARRGFSSIELLVVISVIVILMGALLSGLAILRKSQRRVTTQTTLEGLAHVIDKYLADYGTLGDSSDGSDFAATPAVFLIRRYIDAGKEPLWTPKVSEVQTAAGDPVKNLRDGEVFLDSFRNPLVWTITTAGVAPRTYATAVTITSKSGTEATGDDLIYSMTTATGRWAYTKP